MKLIEKTVITLALIGMAVTFFFLRQSPLMVVGWNLLPYPIAIVAAVRMTSKMPMLCGVVAMLVVDVWLFLETFLGTTSPLLLGVSLLVTLKFFTVFPIGLLVGSLIEKCAYFDQEQSRDETT